MRLGRSSIVSILALVVGLSGLGASTPVVAADDAVYYLPAPAGTALTVARGNGATEGRTAQQDDAFTFVATGEPERFPVVAARGGTVISTRMGAKGGRCAEPLDGPRPRCWRDVNHVLIDHGDGTSALYLHLKRGDMVVRRGQIVSAGQPIGTAGTSGWTDRTGLGFQVQRTPAWSEVGRGGWFLTDSMPVAFADPDITAQRPDGVPQTGDEITSGNPGAAFVPFRFAPRPAGLPASVPFAPDREQEVSAAYDADSPDGYGLHFAAPVEAVTDSLDPGFIPGPLVRPLFGGQLAFAGCATGRSASLGRTVAVSLEVEGTPYLAVHGHLSYIEPSLLDLDPSLPAPIVGPDDVIGHYGFDAPLPEDQTLDCPAGDPAVLEPESTSPPSTDPGSTDPGAADLFVTILRDGAISPQGEIIAGTPVSPEPLVGERGYEGFGWWQGPVVAVEVADEPGRPRARWNAKTAANGSHITFGDTVRLVARVRDASDIEQVRFRAYYPRWPRVDGSRDLPTFDPATTWRELATCSAPDAGQRGFGSLCGWDGDARNAKVTYVWDPQAAKTQPTAPWLPPAERAMTRESRRCVPVSLAVEVIDRAGHVYSQMKRLPVPAACDDRRAQSADGARLVYLDPLVPPRAPEAKGSVRARGWPPGTSADPLGGAIVWRDRSNNEDGFNIYARRKWLEADCSIVVGPWRKIADVPPDKERYAPRHQQVLKSVKVPKIEGVPGALDRLEYSVSAFNEAGETSRVQVAAFVGGSECDTGLIPPPGLEP